MTAKVVFLKSLFSWGLSSLAPLPLLRQTGQLFAMGSIFSDTLALWPRKLLNVFTFHFPNYKEGRIVVFICALNKVTNMKSSANCWRSLSTQSRWAIMMLYDGRRKNLGITLDSSLFQVLMDVCGVQVSLIFNSLISFKSISSFPVQYLCFTLDSDVRCIHWSPGL